MARKKDKNEDSNSKDLGWDIQVELEVMNPGESVINLRVMGPDGEFSPRIPTLSSLQLKLAGHTMKCRDRVIVFKKIELKRPSGEVPGTILADAIFSREGHDIGKYRFTGSLGTWEF